MPLQTLDFEKPILELEEEIASLEADGDPELDEAEHKKRVQSLKRKLTTLKKKTYGGLSPWQRVQLARHFKRPRSLDYIERICEEWIEIKGDRNFRDDPAVLCGLARIDGLPLVIVAQQKGKDTKENVARNFGMMHPEGYRKAMRAMRLAERFGLPVLILIDTPGAYPGIGAEERGQGEAIARNIMEMFDLATPLVGVVIGEGASGGALGIGVADVVLMLENSWYCVISPEGCASILWRDAAKASTAAENLKLTAQDLLDLGVIDGIVAEPEGGAHRDWDGAADALKKAALKEIRKLARRKKETLLKSRFEKYRNMGSFEESE